MAVPFCFGLNTLVAVTLYLPLAFAPNAINPVFSSIVTFVVGEIENLTPLFANSVPSTVATATSLSCGFAVLATLTVTLVIDGVVVVKPTIGANGDAE